MLDPPFGSASIPPEGRPDPIPLRLEAPTQIAGSFSLFPEPGTLTVPEFGLQRFPAALRSFHQRVFPHSAMCGIDRF